MSVAKVSEISATSTKSFEDAIQQGLARASKTLRHIKGAWVKEHQVEVRRRQDRRIPGEHDGHLRARRLGILNCRLQIDDCRLAATSGNAVRQGSCSTKAVKLYCRRSARIVNGNVLQSAIRSLNRRFSGALHDSRFRLRRAVRRRPAWRRSPSQRRSPGPDRRPHRDPLLRRVPLRPAHGAQRVAGHRLSRGPGPRDRRPCRVGRQRRQEVQGRATWPPWAAWWTRAATARAAPTTWSSTARRGWCSPTTAPTRTSPAQ